MGGAAVNNDFGFADAFARGFEKTTRTERGFEDLDGPVVRVATPDVPIPFSPPLEQAVLPSVERVKEACLELLEY